MAGSYRQQNANESTTAYRSEHAATRRRLLLNPAAYFDALWVTETGEERDESTTESPTNRQRNRNRTRGTRPIFPPSMPARWRGNSRFNHLRAGRFLDQGAA